MSEVKEVVDTVSIPHGCADHERHTIVERASVVQSLKNLGGFPWIARLVEAGELSVIGAWFDIALGELYVVDAESGEWVRAGD